MPNPSTIAMQEEAVSEQRLYSNEGGVVVDVYTVPMGTSPEVIKRLEELEQINQDLSNALSHLGKQRIDMQENLKKVGEASYRYLMARRVFEDFPTLTDEMCQELAEAEADLEAKLTAAGFYKG
jgi:hypothetical protein